MLIFSLISSCTESVSVTFVLGCDLDVVTVTLNWSHNHGLITMSNYFKLFSQLG